MPVCGWRESSATARTATTGRRQAGPCERVRDAVAQIVDVQAVVGQHVEVDAAGGLAHLVVEHLRRADEHRPDDERVHLDVVPAQDVVRTALHADAQQAVVGDDGEAVVELVADERLDRFARFVTRTRSSTTSTMQVSSARTITSSSGALVP